MHSLSPAERLAAMIFSGAITATVVLTLWFIHRNSLIEVPVRGGTLTEGIIGSPRFINPLLAISDADRDLAALVYSGLMRAAQNGGLTLDLAESYEISDDGLVYTFTLRPDARFHDGNPVTTYDVTFTVEKAQDSRTKSSKRANWEDVTIEPLDARRVRFTLPKPYAPFLENMTLGILPKHLWQEVTPEEFPFSGFNMQPIGSGPYQVKTVRENVSGIPIGYTLSSFDDYVGGEPYLETLMLRFYPNEDSLVDAFRQGEIESLSGVTPERLLDLELHTIDAHVARTPLPRVFAIFFNQNQMPVFTHKEVRAALDMAIDKKMLIATALSGYGTPINGPLPIHIDPRALDADMAAGSLEDASGVDTTTSTSSTRLEAAADLLKKAGWKKNETSGVFEKKVGGTTEQLTFSIATADSPELKSAAMFVKHEWEMLGASVDIKVFEVGDLTQNIIRPRKYDALLFGEVAGRDLDLFAFWHSSQRTDPGLNIALYANIKADELLAEARTITDDTARLARLKEFADEVRNDIPAVFLYAPDFLYIVPNRIKGFSLTNTSVPEERFLSITDWYTDTELVWPFFLKDRETAKK
jgi:peptide/nickel transport system substrate-binding protein